MQLVALHPVWIMIQQTLSETTITVSSTKPELEPFTGGHFVHLKEGQIVEFANIAEGTDPYQTIMNAFPGYFELKEETIQ